MAILDVSEAKHFCQGYQSTPGVAQGSFRTWSQGLRLNHNFTEGTPSFNEYRDISLREVERLLFLAASQYRRSFDLQLPSASNWAHVTLYYGAFFSAQSLLGAFGCWKLRNKNLVLEANNGQPGQQSFNVQQFTTTYNGSHQQFWDLFYSRIGGLAPWIDPALRIAINPVSGVRTWQIDNRNTINYDSYEALQLMVSFKSSFRKTKFRTSLPGTLSTQFFVMEALLTIASQFVQELGIATDALDVLDRSLNRRLKFKNLIISANIPNLERHVRKNAIR